MEIRNMARLSAPFLALLLALLSPAVANGDANVAPALSAAAAGWPMMLHDNAHTSVSSDVDLSASTASTLGIRWMSAMRNADIGSPVSMYSSALGRTVVYIGDERGDVIAFDALNGATLWSTSIGVGDSIRGSPLIAPDGSVWVGSAEGNVIAKLDGATGQVLCTLKSPLHINSSFMFASPAGGLPTVFVATNHSNVNGSEFAINESNCAIIWSYDGWLTLAGAWATAAFGVDVNGNSRVYVGTSDPDSTEYALDALSGKLIWEYSALNPPNGTFDVGASATVSAPGNNGFADGVLYFIVKYGVLYALDLTTGKRIWQYDFSTSAPGRSAPALYKTTLVYGVKDGVEAVNAGTGTLLWHYTDPSKQEVLSSPAVAGPVGDEIVTFADASGMISVVRLSDGTSLYRYQTGNYVTSSPAIINGHILFDSSDGFLYDFTTGGYNVASPSTAITSPQTGATVANPGATVTVSGTATSNSGNGVTQVQLAVQQGGPLGTWYGGGSGMWFTGATNNFVNVDQPGNKTSTWSFAIPVTRAGSTYQVTANAVDAHHQVDRVGAQSSFTVLPNKNAPQLTLSTTTVAPAGSFVASGGPFKASETVNFTLQNATVGSAVAGTNGYVGNTTLEVPHTALFGPSALGATGTTSHKSTSAEVDVTNLWTQAGYDATHSGYEPNDPIIGDTLESTNAGYLSLAWHSAAGAPIEAPPAIFAGSAYVATTAGSVSAVDTASGADFWSYTIPSGAAIHGAPAVGNGDVVFGADDGNLYRLAAANGAALGVVALDGVPTDPALVAGTIYVGTDNGTVFALDETTGNQLWSATVGSAISLPPAVDGAAGLLFVGDDAGNVTVLNPTNGAILGQIQNGGASVTVAPAIAGGRLFVGASDGKLRAYNETSRALEWTYATGAPIRALATDSTDVYAGNDAATLYKIAASSGGLVFSDDAFGSALEGIAHTSNVSIMTSSQGYVTAVKDTVAGGIKYRYKTGAGLDAQPAILDGTAYVAGEDGNLYAFTTHGQAPEGAIEHLMLSRLRQHAKIRAPWTHPRINGPALLATRAFAPHGRRDFALHIERSPAPIAAGAPPSSRDMRTYIVGWSPVAVRAEAFVDRTRATLGAVAGAAVDTTPYPHLLDDAAVQREVARDIAANGWQPNARSRFIVLTAAAPVSRLSYCEYHSAFYLRGNLAAPVAYGVVPAGTTEECGPIEPQIERERKQLDLDPFARAR
jgi:outer membrane protein assembly factor BamB